MPSYIHIWCDNVSAIYLPFNLWEYENIIIQNAGPYHRSKDPRGVTIQMPDFL